MCASRLEIKSEFGNSSMINFWITQLYVENSVGALYVCWKLVWEKMSDSSVPQLPEKDVMVSFVGTVPEKYL